MHSTLRKALALVSALVMLCTLLPLGIFSASAAATNLIKNGNFENISSTAWVTYQDSGLSMEAAYEGICGMHLTGDGSYNAMAYQDFKTTIGKSYMQSTFELSDGSAVGISIGKYCTPNGVSLAEVGGLKPDVEVVVDDETYAAIYAGTLEPENDPQLQAAIAAVKAAS